MGILAQEEAAVRGDGSAVHRILPVVAAQPLECRFQAGMAEEQDRWHAVVASLCRHCPLSDGVWSLLRRREPVRQRDVAAAFLEIHLGHAGHLRGQGPDVCSRLEGPPGPGVLHPEGHLDRREQQADS